MNIKVSLCALLLLSGSAIAMEGYYRSPALHGETVAFTAEGDIWIHDLSDGNTERLTTHPSLEIQASISPDGSQIAYRADYEGVNEVYLIPVSGGVPRRLTYENAGVTVQGWTSEGAVLYSTNSRAGAPWNLTLKTVDPQTLETSSLPLADAMDGTVDEDSKYLYFTQFGLQWGSDNVNAYHGGMQGRLWRYRMGSGKEALALAHDHPGSVRRPMLHNDQLYFISDASGRNNLWSSGPGGENPEQVTRHEELSVRGISMDDGKAVYQLGPDLYLLDLSSKQSEKLEIELTSDHPGLREAWVKTPLKYLTSARLSGDGNKLAVTARGRIALAGTNQERLVSVGTPAGFRMRFGALSKDGKYVYAVSDAAEEQELWRYSAFGATNAEQLTTGGKTLRGRFFESPDGKWIAHDDGAGGLWLLNTGTKDNKRIIENGHVFSDFRFTEWSPDSSLLAVAYRKEGDARNRIFVYSVSDKKSAYLTTDKYVSFAPTFSRDGKWLYYLSNRNFKSAGGSVWKDRDFGPSFDKQSEVYVHALSEDAGFAFQPLTELSVSQDEEDKKDKKDKDDGDEDSPSEPVVVEWSGLMDRIRQVPVPAGNYNDLVVGESHLYLLTGSNDGSEIKSVKLEPNAQPATFTDGVNSIELSDDGKQLLVVKGQRDETTMFIVPAAGEFPSDVSKNTVQTAGWRFSVEPRVEWSQLFHDAWLMHREQFFDRHMRGVDWMAMKDKYRPMLDRVTDRRELNDVLGQMMGELNALHSGVRGGAIPSDPDAPVPASLGAEFKQVTSGIEIARIYDYDPEMPSEAAPLARADVDAREGDLIVAVNGIRTASLQGLYRALRNQVGKQVLLDLRRGHESIKTVVVPVKHNQDSVFRYRSWVRENQEKVETVDEDLGYLHLANMG
ncbi:MAG: peptidase S41, partial [Gammaproteobacteria bacterium]|nr:peptidase S41 [Gammaproteobacteria bacterium]